jgi:hypothetical protein
MSWALLIQMQSFELLSLLVLISLTVLVLVSLGSAVPSSPKSVADLSLLLKSTINNIFYISSFTNPPVFQ